GRSPKQVRRATSTASPHCRAHRHPSTGRRDSRRTFFAFSVAQILRVARGASAPWRYTAIRGERHFAHRPFATETGRTRRISKASQASHRHGFVAVLVELTPSVNGTP